MMFTRTLRSRLSARLLVPIALVVLLFAVVAFVGGARVAHAAGPVTVTLDAQNGSGESGTAVLTDLGNGKTRVEVTVTGAPADVPQPLHIHDGTCATLDPKPKYPLTSAVNGKSTTEVDVSLADLQSEDYAINGHKSAAEAGVYVFCGTIPRAAATALPTTGGDMSGNALLIALLGMALVVAGFFTFRLAPRSR